MECEPSRGEPLRELEAEIDERIRQLTDVERVAAWLQPSVLVRPHERDLLMSARKGSAVKIAGEFLRASHKSDDGNSREQLAGREPHGGRRYVRSSHCGVGGVLPGA
jgi:hypothetical protein